MSFNKVVSSERIHIGFFGLRNAGKSSVVNAVTNQELSVVSDVKGTTTDPVKKAMELLPLGPVVIIDTPGFDDIGDLGELRVKKTREILSLTDIAVLVVDATIGISKIDNELIALFKEKNTPYIIAFNKSDLIKNRNSLNNEIYVSAKTNEGINNLKEALGKLAKQKDNLKPIVCDLLNKGDTVILVIPIDESAPKGRIILPQQLVLRELLDYNCTAICCKETELFKTINSLKQKPSLVICDSQVFKEVDEILEEDILLTSFSILFARYKGDLKTLVNGANTLTALKDGANILISEGCTHHRQCNDIGTVKIPNLVQKFTNKSFNFSFTSGGEFPEDLEKYDLIIHCGGCMLNEKEMKSRLEKANKQNIPIVNYGVILALMNGILERALKVFNNL